MEKWEVKAYVRKETLLREAGITLSDLEEDFRRAAKYFRIPPKKIEEIGFGAAFRYLWDYEKAAPALEKLYAAVDRLKGRCEDVARATYEDLSRKERVTVEELARALKGRLSAAGIDRVIAYTGDPPRRFFPDAIDATELDRVRYEEFLGKEFALVWQELLRPFVYFDPAGRAEGGKLLAAAAASVFGAALLYWLASR